MDLLKKHLEKDGQRFYSEILAVKIADNIEVFINPNVDKRELTEIITKVIQNHLVK